MRPRARDRTDRARVRDGMKGSGLLEDGPADVGSSKSKVSGFGADVDGSHIRNMDLVCCIQKLTMTRD
jgi:hypothetical protein